MIDRQGKLPPALLVLTAGICFSHIHQGTLAVDAVKYASIAYQILETGVWLPLFDPYSETDLSQQTTGTFLVIGCCF